MNIDIFKAYETDLKLRGAKPESITNFVRVATRWRRWCDDNGLDPMAARKADVQAWLLSTGWAPTTMRQVGLVSLSAAYSFAVDDLEIIDRNPCRKVRLPKPIQHVVRTVPNRVLREIKAHARDDYDLMLFCLFAYTGCRTVEVVGLTWNNVFLDDNLMLVLGKGDKERLVPIHRELRQLPHQTKATARRHRPRDTGTARCTHYPRWAGVSDRSAVGCLERPKSRPPPNSRVEPSRQPRGSGRPRQPHGVEPRRHLLPTLLGSQPPRTPRGDHKAVHGRPGLTQTLPASPTEVIHATPRGPRSKNVLRAWNALTWTVDPRSHCASTDGSTLTSGYDESVCYGVLAMSPPPAVAVRRRLLA